MKKNERLCFAWLGPMHWVRVPSRTVNLETDGEKADRRESLSPLPANEDPVTENCCPDPGPDPRQR